MPYIRLLKTWDRLRMRFYRDIIQDELTEALHPDFGYVWQEGGQGHEYIEQARQEGFRAGQKDQKETN
jgi:hypothetical protein